ncbi:cytochrome c oxidase assembly protein [Fodinicurvata sp. EGI_FJ10296]|uniref:cytochrome c oxidase assembly protein n=1 Tax=Fodinicurvata sp. EGI_FJ10296 TaxID=3231908 RepID=UPI003455011E
MTDAPIPYCGIPPVPEEVWRNWNLDPVLIAILAGLVVHYAMAAPRTGVSHGDRRAGMAGWAVVATVFVSPICSLSMALFSVRMGQHVVLALIAAPLLVAGGAHRCLFWPLSRQVPRLPAGISCAGGALFFAVAFWGWHLPGPYALTLYSDAAYWLMQITLIAAALLLWDGISRMDEAPGAAVGAAIGTGFQMAIYGAILMFSETAWHGFHATTTIPFGLSDLDDQRLAAALMWAPGAIGFLIVGLAFFAGFLRRLELRSGTGGPATGTAAGSGSRAQG